MTANLGHVLVQNLDTEQIRKIARMKAIEQNRKFIQLIKDTIKYIEERKPNDRLSYASGIEDLTNGMAGSIKGWQKWCTLGQMNHIKEGEIKKYYTKMRKIVLEWLKLDLEATEARNKEIEDELKKDGIKIDDEPKKKKKMGEKTKPQKHMYVA